MTKPNDLARSGVIRPDELYTLPEIVRRTGLGAWALRQARRNGLKVKYSGGRGFVLGRDFIQHVIDTGDEMFGSAKRAAESGSADQD
jgi:hypothetical protein